MLIQDSDFAIIQDHVTRRFGNLSPTDLNDLVAEAISFLSTEKITALSNPVLKALENHLRPYRQRQRRSEVEPERSRTIQISNLMVSPDSKESDEETLGRLSRMPNASKGIEAQSLQEELEFSEQELERWGSVLPAIEFEALKRMTVPNVKPYLTDGLTNKGLWIFFRRARIRMKWARLSIT